MEGSGEVTRKLISKVKVDIKVQIEVVPHLNKAELGANQFQMSTRHCKTLKLSLFSPCS